MVLVVGAGPTGLALACGLLSHGIPVRVVDRAAGPAVTSRANFVHARGSEVLARLGALGDLPTESLRAMKVTTYLGDRPLATVRFGDPTLRTAAAPMVVSQARVEAALRDRLTALGGRIDWKAGLTGLDQDDTGVTVTLGTGESVRADWVVGCDGTGSATREQAGIGFPGVRISERYLLADLHIDWDLDRDGTTGWVSPAGMVGAMPMPGPGEDLWRLLAYDPTSAQGRPTEQEIMDRFRRILPERTGHTDAHIRDVTWASVFTVHRRLADTYRQGRVLLAGDAAHVHAPFGGQGMLTGLGDAENLAWKLALVVREHASESLLDTYQAERRPLAAQVLRGTTAVTRVNIAANPVGRFVRDRVVAPLLNLAPVQRLASYSASQLWVSYRTGPLGAGRLGHKPRPGDRVPDLACTHPDGRPTRLHTELGGRFALLVPDDAPGWSPNQWGVTLRFTEGRPGEAWLVRPDAHLAWRGRDPASLARWMTETLTTGPTR
ncbi:FAD-dependent monooxygenase [Actinophytocola xinjiangensis]|nr:FAD-dependent monooxygenase [Actinophytocola xinjiangensis]